MVIGIKYEKPDTAVEAQKINLLGRKPGLQLDNDRTLCLDSMGNVLSIVLNGVAASTFF